MDDRRDDWRHGVDENLASLNAGQRVYENDLEKIHEAQDDMDQLLRGGTDEFNVGLVGRFEVLERDMAKINSILFGDPTGHKGLLQEVNLWREGREDRRINLGNWTKIIVAIIMSGALGIFWKDIRDYFIRKQPETPIEKIIEHGKHPHIKRYVPHFVPKESEEETPEQP